MKEILKILQAYKNGKITEKELSVLLEIKKRGKFHIVKTEGNYFQVWNKNSCFFITDKEEAEKFISDSEKLLKLCLE